MLAGLTLLFASAIANQFTQKLLTMSCEDALPLYIEHVHKTFASDAAYNMFKVLFCDAHSALSQVNFSHTDASFSEPVFNRALPASAFVEEELATRPVKEDTNPVCENGNFNMMNPMQPFNDTLPASYDLREVGLMPIVQNQQQLGSCWAFATTGILASFILRNAPDYIRDPNYAPYFGVPSSTLNLSEQFLLNQSHIYCGGSSFYYAINRYAIGNVTTVELDSDFPYTGGTGNCPLDITTPVAKIPPSAYLAPFRTVTAGPCLNGYFYVTGFGFSVMSDATRYEVKTLLARGIALSTSLYTTTNGSDSADVFSNYVKGVLTYPCVTQGMDHAAVYIGYGKFDGQDVWVLRNSWGEDWGVWGYYYTAYGGNVLCSEMSVLMAVPKYLGFDYNKVFYPFQNTTFNYNNNSNNPLIRGTGNPNVLQSGLDIDPSVTCNETFFVLGSLCVNCSAAGCLTCTSTTNCTSCLPGFMLVSGACYPNGIPNCAVQVPYTRNCTECMRGFKLQDNKCIGKEIPNCMAQTEEGSCAECYPNYILTDGVCTLKVIPNCHLMNAEGRCYQCESSYSLNDGECRWKLWASCSYMSSETMCRQCIPSYEIVNNTSCQPIIVQNCAIYNSMGNCVQCNEGYILNNVTGQCDLPLGPNCLNQYTNGTCYMCKPGYYLNDASKCEKEDVLHCIYYTHNGSCSQCEGGYALQNAQCVPSTILGCKTMDMTGVCTSCTNGFTFLTGNCVVLIPNCITYNTKGECTSCSSISVPDGAYPNITKCYPRQGNLTDCEQALNASYCSVCMKGWSLSRGSCVSEFPNCMSWIGTAKGRKCTECTAGFTLSTENYLCIPSADADPSAPCITKSSVPYVQFVPKSGLFFTFFTPPHCVINLLVINVTVDNRNCTARLYNSTNLLGGATHLTYYMQFSGNSPTNLTVQPLVPGAGPIDVLSDNIVNSTAPPNIDMPTDSSSDRNALSGGAIFGIVIAVIAVIVAIALGVYFSMRKKRLAKSNDPFTVKGAEEIISTRVDASARTPSNASDNAV